MSGRRVSALAGHAQGKTPDRDGVIRQYGSSRSEVFADEREWCVVKRFARIRGGLLVVAVVLTAIVWAVLYFAPERNTETHTLADEEYMIGGHPTTCTELFGAPCDFALQIAYNRWGADLEEFVNSDAYGSFARSIGFPASAKLSLQACYIAKTPGRISFDFLDTARVDHPNAPTAELLVFWNRSRQELCPDPMGSVW